VRNWTRAVLSVLLLLALPAQAPAQERGLGIGVDLGLTHFWGASRSADPANPGLKPYRPTSIALRLDRGFGRVRAGIGLQYANSGLGIDGDDVVLVSKGELKWVEVAPEVGIRVATLGPVTVLRAFAGPLVDIWAPAEEDGRMRVGGHAGLALEVPLGPHLDGTLRVRGAVSGSVFRPEELPPGYELSTMPRAGVALGLRYGL
jgi:hypothetical protein